MVEILNPALGIQDARPQGENNKTLLTGDWPGRCRDLSISCVLGVVSLFVNGVKIGQTAQSTARNFESQGLVLNSNVINNQPASLNILATRYYPKGLSDQELIDLTRL